MTKFMLWLYCCILALFLHSANAKDNCLNIAQLIKEASAKYIAQDFPYWYNIALAKKETNCRWLTSLDGHGSVGYFQLTPKFLDALLKPLFPDYTKPYSKDHFYAFAYYLNTLIKSNPVPRLWIVYQRYNGGNYVINECKLVKSYEYTDCLNACYNCKQLGGKRCRGKVCVWKTASGCKQYRHACAINYSYSRDIYEFAKAYRTGSDKNWQYW